MHVLIVGGNGFLGSSLAIGLRACGCRVRVYDRTPARSDVDWSEIDYRTGGLDERDALAAALDGVTLVYHLASSTVPSTSNSDPSYDVNSNLIGSLNLIAAMVAARIRRIVFFSSGGTVYGDPDSLPINEDHPLRPISSYGVVKIAIENYLSMYARLGVLEPLILRPSNPYGPRQSTAGVQGAVGAFLGKALAGDGVKVWGNGETVRDYIYVDDLMELAIKAGLSNQCGIYNAGSGTGYSLNQLCTYVRELTGSLLPAEYLEKRDFDVSTIILDISSACRNFDWTPRVTLREGLDRTWRALQPT
jgi:UDP-glucose 4-epimerase